MQVRDPLLLASYMRAAELSQSKLAREVGCSRQYIHLLVTGRRTCTQRTGELVEKALRVLPGTIFVEEQS